MAIFGSEIEIHISTTLSVISYISFFISSISCSWLCINIFLLNNVLAFVTIILQNIWFAMFVFFFFFYINIQMFVLNYLDARVCTLLSQISLCLELSSFDREVQVFQVDYSSIIVYYLILSWMVQLLSHGFISISIFLPWQSYMLLWFYLLLLYKDGMM